MKNINIEARIKRNKLDLLAGDFFQKKDSQIVKDLNLKGKSAILGIQREDGVYTIIGDKSTYFRTVSNIEGEIAHQQLLDIFKKNSFKLGQFGNYEFVSINDKDSIWVLNGATMTALWNIILLLNDNN